MIIGILLRLVLMPYLVWPYDITAYQSGLVRFMNGYNPYDVRASIYPPFAYLLTLPLFKLAYYCGFSSTGTSVSEFAKPTDLGTPIAIFQANPLFLVLWKLPLLLFDTLTGILIYLFAKEFTVNSHTPRKCFLVWFFNPFTLAISFVHGSYDVVVAFMILLGTFFLYKRNYFSAGISFGLGTLTKTSPIFVALPLAVIMLLADSLNPFRWQRLKVAILSFSKMLAGCALPLLLAGPLFTSYFTLMYSGVPREVFIAGGLNQWFFAADPERAYMVNRHISEIQTTFLFYPLIGVTVSFLLYKFAQQDWRRILLFSSLFTTLIYFFVPMTIQPQYLLWIIPLLLVSVSQIRSFFWVLCAYSIAGLLFYIAVLGPSVFLYPLTMNTSLYSPEELVRSVGGYANLPGIVTKLLRQDLCMLFGGIGFSCHLLTLFLLIRTLRRKEINEE